MFGCSIFLAYTLTEEPDMVLLPIGFGIVFTLIAGVLPFGEWTFVKHQATKYVTANHILVVPKNVFLCDPIVTKDMGYIEGEADIVKIEQRNMFGGCIGTYYQIEPKATN